MAVMQEVGAYNTIVALAMELLPLVRTRTPVICDHNLTPISSELSTSFSLLCLTFENRRLRERKARTRDATLFSPPRLALWVYQDSDRIARRNML